MLVVWLKTELPEQGGEALHTRDMHRTRSSTRPNTIAQEVFVGRRITRSIVGRALLNSESSRIHLFLSLQ